MLEHIQNSINVHSNLKVNTVFNGEFIAGEKRAFKSVNTLGPNPSRHFDSGRNFSGNRCSERCLNPLEVDSPSYMSPA